MTAWCRICPRPAKRDIWTQCYHCNCGECTDTDSKEEKAMVRHVHACTGSTLSPTTHLIAIIKRKNGNGEAHVSMHGQHPEPKHAPLSLIKTKKALVRHMHACTGSTLSSTTHLIAIIQGDARSPQVYHLLNGLRVVQQAHGSLLNLVVHTDLDDASGIKRLQDAIGVHEVQGNCMWQLWPGQSQDLDDTPGGRCLQNRTK